MRVLIIGMGHVGHWLKRYISGIEIEHDIPAHDVQWLDLKPKKIKKPIQVLHIAIPYSQRFSEETIRYIKEFEPKLTLIESTVPPKTTIRIYQSIMEYNALNDYMLGHIHLAHSPIRGQNWNWQRFVKMIGPVDEKSGKAAEKYYQRLGLKTKVLKSPLETELGKLLETTIYGLHISFVQEIYRMCKKLGVDFKQAYEEFSKTFTLDPYYQIPRAVFWPGVIGKHCVIPNATLLHNFVYPSKFLEAMLESNLKRKQELQEDPKDMP